MSDTPDTPTPPVDTPQDTETAPLGTTPPQDPPGLPGLPQGLPPEMEGVFDILPEPDITAFELFILLRNSLRQHFKQRVAVTKEAAAAPDWQHVSRHFKKLPPEQARETFMQEVQAEMFRQQQARDWEQALARVSKRGDTPRKPRKK